MTGKFLEQALQFATTATQQDEAGDYKNALSSYTNSLDWFQAAIKYEKNAKFKAEMRKKSIEYVDRAEKLKSFLAEQGDAAGKDSTSPSSSSSSPTTGAGTTANGKSAKVAADVDGESKKMRGALEGLIVIESPNVHWDDVAGLHPIKETLKLNIVMPLQFPELFQGECQPFNAILLYGPPGTGKSHLARAVATEAGSAFFSIKPSDLVSKWMGDSEKLVKSLFAMASERERAIIFIDEIDALTGSRDDSGSHEASRRLLTEFLIHMDGVQKLGAGILILAATNLPWKLDSAVRRRFQLRVHIGLPDKLARAELMRLAVGPAHTSFSKNDFLELAEVADGFSGSDIKVAMRYAVMAPIRMIQESTHFRKVSHEGQVKYTPCSPGYPDAVEMPWTKIKSGELLKPPLLLKDLKSAMKNTKPSVGKEELEKQHAWTLEYGGEGA